MDPECQLIFFVYFIKVVVKERNVTNSWSVYALFSIHGKNNEGVPLRQNAHLGLFKIEIRIRIASKFLSRIDFD